MTLARARASRALAALAATLLLAAPALAEAAEVPSPFSVLGFSPGAERQLADWLQITDYFHRLDAASARVFVAEVGQTTEGRPFLVVTITSEANMARLEEIRRANLRLFDPRALTPETAETLIREGKTIVALHHGIHATEVGPSQAALATAHWLASSDDDDVREILDRCVILMIPSHNPDGTQRVVEWYRRTLGSPFEGHEPPFLYHHYTGHDNNRDWYAFTQMETRLTVEHVYDRWRPHIVHDLHQMGDRGARMFLPPYTDPYEPNVDGALVAAVNALGTHMAARLLSAGKTGVVVGELFDGYSPARAYPHTHGGVRLLSETASARMASPLEVAFADLAVSRGFDPRQPSWNFPKPWPGGPWTLADIVDYETLATRALLEHAARHREFWLRTSHDVLRRAATRTDLQAYVLPGHPKDAYAAAKLVETLRRGSVEVSRARSPFTAGGREFPAGSLVVPMQQPFSAFAKQLLERQAYPDLRQHPGGPPQRPYDVTAHTLPLLMGVETVAIAHDFSADLEPVERAAPSPGGVSGHGRFFALGHKTGELIALGRLLRAGVKVLWAKERFEDQGAHYPAGTLLVPASARGLLGPLTVELGISAHAVGKRPAAFALHTPRVGLYQSWVASMDEGWTRFVFEKQMGVSYETLHDQDVRKGGLRARYDAIVLPDQTKAQILHGHPPGTLPGEYTGGLGPAGAGRLAEFVKEGGTLVALDSASLFAIEELSLPVKALPPDPEFYCPGAILRAVVEGASPLAHGLEGEAAVWFESSPVFTADTGAVLRYPTSSNPLLSGWLLGERHLQGRAALVEQPLGRGRVVLFGFRPQYHGQTWATYIPFLNALYQSAAH